MTTLRTLWGRTRRLATTGNLVIAIALLLALPLLIRRGGDADFFAHLRTGQAIVDMRGLPTHEIYTYTTTASRWVDQEYGSEVLGFALLNALGGKALISIGFGVLLTIGFLLILARINLRPAPPMVTAAVLLLGAAVGIAIWGPRPQMVTFTGACLTLYLVERHLLRPSRLIYVLPIAVAVWANLHAGFIFALLIVGLAAASEFVVWLVNRSDAGHLRTARTLTVVFGACAVAGLLTPYGPSLYTYIWRTESSRALPNFSTEWLSPNFHNLSTLPFEASIVLLVIAMLVYRPRLHQLVIAAVTLALALQSVRHIAIFLAAATPLIAWGLGDAWHRLRAGDRLESFVRGRRRHLRTLTTVALGVTVVAVTAFVGDALAKQNASTRANFPVAASDWLAAHPDVGTRMFDEDGWNGYLSYRFYPQVNRRVFILSDPTLAGDTLMNDYTDVTTLKSDWQDVLRRYGVDYVIYEPDSTLGTALDLVPQWHRVYTDTMAAIWVRSAT